MGDVRAGILRYLYVVLVVISDLLRSSVPSDAL